MTTHQSEAEVLTKVVRRIENQGFLPTSPGALADGEVVFCAGAAFVYEAALPSIPRAASKGFALALLKSGKVGLSRTAAELGLNARLVEQLISSNDSFTDDERKSGMLDAIHKLAV